MCPMMPKTALSTLLLLASMVLPVLAAAAHKAVHLPCSQTCGTGVPAKQNLTYPFGFSPGCPIQLNCSEDGDALIGEFLVQSASPDTITITVETKCDRPFRSIDQLYGRNYAPMGTNSVLLNNCAQTSACDVPRTQVIQAQFQSRCEPSNKTNTSMSCYSEKANHYNAMFLNRSGLFDLGCEYFLSSISAEELNDGSVPLRFQMLHLSWWVNGDECECSQDADCVQLLGLPNGGGNGFRCKCRDGFLGDGLLAGTGCRRAKSSPKWEKEETLKVLTIVLPLMVLVVVSMLILSGVYVITRKRKFAEVLEDWERDYSPHRFKYKDLYVATKGFRDQELLGAGGFGRVYRGILPTSNIEVAVKRVSHESKQGMREFVAEIITIGRLRHRNLVSLLGYSRRKRELLLVYDYMPNGSLDKYLYNQPKVTLNWMQRFRVIKGVASGLLYLHEGWEQVVIHRDIKASNILLDAELNGRLGDFGLARLHDHGTDPQTTHVIGTLGYLAPEQMRTGKATRSTDVFAFGAFLLEVACGRRPIKHGDTEDVLLVDSVFSCWDSGDILEVSDPNLGAEFVEGEMELVLKLGLMCSHSNPLMRPSMRQVSQYLEGDLPMPELPSTGISSCRLTFAHRPGLDDLVVSCPSSTGEASVRLSSVAESILSGGR
ncbi:L-type lectin-domain containing receptor kinase IV.1-like [Syzygium oleosum]|uniref:L-type lectin-domain containing receptor kinase IV.1-like n=1 Tax=Syzygium oleosum TaxID=219896 RepID=UPI0024BAAF55|nr:L-type lectin-domain containing receptor kinase IV.1-like [Syzygium oleosum]